MTMKAITWTFLALMFPLIAKSAVAKIENSFQDHEEAGVVKSPDLYPYGDDLGDLKLPPSHDDGEYYGFVKIERFPFYGNSNFRVCINTDGTLILWGNCESLAGKVISQIWESAIIGPMNTDLNTLLGGTVYFRETKDQPILDRVKNHVVARYNEELSKFTPTWAFVVTWDHIYTPVVFGEPFNSTFQCVLTTDGTKSFAIFLYVSLYDEDGHTASAGFSAGDDGARYFQLPVRPDELVADSNIGEAGTWVFRVDQNDIWDSSFCEMAGSCAENHKHPITAACDIELTILTPKLATCNPVLSDPILIDDGNAFKFDCGVELEPHPDPAVQEQSGVKVTFFADGAELTSYQANNITTFTLTLVHGLLKNHFYKSLRCEAYTFSSTALGYKESYPVRSRTYWIGVVPTVSDIRVDMFSGVPVTLGIVSTIPIPCILGNGTCTVPVKLTASSKNVALMLVDGDKDNTKNSKCKYALRHENWDPDQKLVTSPDQKIYIRPFPKVPRPMSDIITVTLSLDPLYTELWTNITGLPNSIWSGINSNFTIQVTGDSSRSLNWSSCYWWGDPHIVTWDKIEYESKYESYTSPEAGRHISVRSGSDRIFEVLTEQWTTHHSKATDCGVLVREGNVAYQLSRCLGQGQMRYIQMSEESLMYNPFSVFGEKEWRLTMPSGSYVQIRDERTYFQLYIHVPWRDWNNTVGLCGTNDGNKENELLKRDGTFSSWSDPSSKFQPMDFINSWSLSDYPEEDLFENCLPADPTFPRHLKEGEYCACYGSDQQCGWDVLHTNIHDGSNYIPDDITNVEPPLCESQPYRKQKRDLYMPDVDENPQPRINISYAEAEILCRNHLLASSTYGACSGRMSTEQLDSLIDICAVDIEFTGETSWMESSVGQLQGSCRDHVFMNVANDTVDQIIDEVRNLTTKMCPNDCSGEGSCINSVCVCTPGFMGSDCGLSENAVPVLTYKLDSQMCDIQSNPGGCSIARLLTEDAASGEKLTCSLEIEQVNGQNFTRIVNGIKFTLDEVRCPLPRLSDMTSPGTALPAYKYEVTISNNNITFSSPAPNSQQHVVYDSLCLTCDQNAVCTELADTCIIGTQCYGSQQLNPENVCLQCLPDQSTDTWLPLEVNHAPLVRDTTLFRMNGTDWVSRLRGLDVEGQILTYTLIDAASHPDITLHPNGTLQWSTSPNEASQIIEVQVDDQCGASSRKNISLVVTCPAVLCSYHGLCLYEASLSVCVCDEYYTGAACEREIKPGEWTPWEDSNCTKSCDYGTYTQMRECLREPCEGLAIHWHVCNEFNCPEKPEEKDEGVNMTVHDNTLQEFALKSESLEMLTTQEVDEYCNNHPQTCCTGLGVNYADVVWTPHLTKTKIASSYPRQDPEGIDTRVKIILSVSDADRICNVDTVVNAFTNGTLVYMEPSVLYEALKSVEENIEMTLDLSLSIDNPVEPEGGGVESWIIGLAVGCVCVVIIIVLATTLTTLKKKRLDNRSVSPELPKEDYPGVNELIDDKNSEISIKLPKEDYPGADELTDDSKIAIKLPKEDYPGPDELIYQNN